MSSIFGRKLPIHLPEATPARTVILPAIMGESIVKNGKAEGVIFEAFFGGFRGVGGVGGVGLTGFGRWLQA